MSKARCFEREASTETLYAVQIPGAFRRQRHDRRNPKPKPKVPLVLYFTEAQLVALRANVVKVLLKAKANR